MADAVTLIFDIASFSSVMVLIVLGLGVIASMMGIFNFAHGEFVLLGAYTVYLSASAGLGLWFGIFAAPIVVGLLGLAMERIIIRRFYASPIIAMLGTYAIGLVIRETVRGLLGGQYDQSRSRSKVRSRSAASISRSGGPSSSAQRWWCCWRAGGCWPHPSRAAYSRRTGKSDAGAGLRHFDNSAVRADICVRLRACRAGGGIDRTAVSAIGGHRHPVPGAGLFCR